MRRSLLPKDTSGSSNGVGGIGRCTDFIALIDHADLADTSNATFAEHVNREGMRVFELNNPVKSNVRHIGKEETGEGDYDYCIAFFNRRTKQTEFKPVSFLRVEPRNKSEVENSGLLEGKLLVPEKKVVIDYNISKTFTAEEYKEGRTNLTRDFGNTRKRKALDANMRRQIGDESMAVMNSSMISQSMNESGMNATGDASTLNGDLKDISLLKTPVSSVLPKMNQHAKSPEEVFDLQDFFETEEKDIYIGVAKTFFNIYSSVDKLCELGVPRFIALRILESCRRSDLSAASALKLALLSIALPRGRSFSVNMSYKKIEFLTPQLNMVFDESFVHGKVKTIGKGKGDVVIEKIYKDKMIAHIFSLYFALTSSGNFTLPVGWISTELQVTEGVAKTMLQNIGCLIQAASPEETRQFNTTQIARLVGPIRAGARGRGVRSTKRK